MAKTNDRLRIEYVPVATVALWEANPKKHDFEELWTSISRHGFKDPPKFEPSLNNGRGGIVEGNGRSEVLAAKQAEGAPVPRGIAVDDEGRWLMPVLFGVDAESERAAEAYAIDHNNLTLAGFDALDIASLYDPDAYKAVLESLAEAEVLPVSMDADDIAEMLKGNMGEEPRPKMAQDEARGTLVERFGVPPMSVLDARQGYWQKRKNAWLALGLQSFAGRADHLVYHASAKPPTFYDLRNEMRAGTGVDPSWDEVNAEAARRGMLSPAVQGTSIFDPVLAELVYRWFCPKGGTVLDPCSGGSVRGIVANEVGRRYYGVDLRQEQVDANEGNWSEWPGAKEARPVWLQGDSTELDNVAGLPEAVDCVFTCPPYADLEVYSDDPRDLSNMPYREFLEAYGRLIGQSVARLREDRFAVFVVGEVRDRRGVNRGFIRDTIDAFEAAGMQFYNEAILVTQLGSSAIRAGNMFEKSRKLCRTHQHVLVFVKGDARAATAAVGECEFGDLQPAEEGEQGEANG